MKIALVGTHSTGKTTVAEAVSEEFGYGLLTEVCRRCPLPINEDADTLSESWMFGEQISQEYILSHKYDILVCDRSSLDLLAYIQRLHKYNRVTNRELEALTMLCTKWADTYDLIFYVPIEFPLVCDGVRSEDETFRTEIDELVKQLLKEQRINYVTLSGSIAERKERFRNIVLAVRNYTELDTYE